MVSFEGFEDHVFGRGEGLRDTGYLDGCADGVHDTVVGVELVVVVGGVGVVGEVAVVDEAEFGAED